MYYTQGRDGQSETEEGAQRSCRSAVQEVQGREASKAATRERSAESLHTSDGGASVTCHRGTSKVPYGSLDQEGGQKCRPHDMAIRTTGCTERGRATPPKHCAHQEPRPRAGGVEEIATESSAGSASNGPKEGIDAQAAAIAAQSQAAQRGIEQPQAPDEGHSGRPDEGGGDKKARSEVDHRAQLCSDTTGEEGHAEGKAPTEKPRQAERADRVGGMQVLQKGCLLGAWASTLLFLPEEQERRGRLLATPEGTSMPKLEPRMGQQACQTAGKMGLEELGRVDKKVSSARPDMSSALYAGECQKADDAGEVEDMSTHFKVLYDDDTAYKPYPRSGKRAKNLAKAHNNSTQQADSQPTEVEADQREGSTINFGKEVKASQDYLYRSGKKVDEEKDGLGNKDPKALTEAQKAVDDLGHSEEGTKHATLGNQNA